MLPTIFALILTALALVYYFLYLKVTKGLPKSFPSAATLSTVDHSKKVIVCFGDSNTHGNVSHDWVEDLSSELADCQFINAGRNSDLTYTLLQRIEDVVACQPDCITLLIGTNDVNATMNAEMEQRYQKLKRIDKQTHPNFEEFKVKFNEIISILKTKTKAKIAVMSLPVMGENLHHVANLKADKYSDFIKQTAQEEQLTYLPLREAQKAYLTEHPSASKNVFEDTYKLISISVVMHYILGFSWDKITKQHGFQLTPDNLHQNSISGGMIKKLVTDFIKN